MLQNVQHVNDKVFWANIHLLFWLSIIHFASGWMGENHFTKWPVILYGVILLMAGVAYFLLAHALVDLHGENSPIARAIGSDRKGTISIVIYAAGIGAAFSIRTMGSLPMS